MNELATVNPENEIAQTVAQEIARQANHSGAASDAQMVDLFVSTRKAESTRQSYARSIAAFMGFCDKPLSEINVMDFNAYKLIVDETYSSAATRRNKMMPIKSFLTYANKVGFLRFNVGAAVQVESAPQLVHAKVISESNIIRVVDGLDNETHRLMVYVLYASGGRVTEFVNLKWADVLFDDGVIIFTETKNGQPREVPISEKVVQMLKDHKTTTDCPTGSDEYIFLATYAGTCKQYTRAAINNFLNRLGKKLGIKITPHMFRHSIATHAISAGVAPSVVRDRLGHSSLQVTSLYAHGDQGAALTSSVLS